MDDKLHAMLTKSAGKMQLELNYLTETVAIIDAAGVAGEPYAIKPLPQLYGNGTGMQSVDLADESFLSLLLAIEEAILDACKADPALTDSSALAALDRLCMTPEANVQNDELAASIQFALRVTLSLNDFSRQDVRHCLRKVKQSTARHNKLAGTRGYLNFLRKMLKGR